MHNPITAITPAPPHPAPVAPLAGQKAKRAEWGCIARAMSERGCWQIQRCRGVCVRFKFRAFDVLITFRAADEKIDMRRPIPATIATSATFLFIIV